MKPDLATWITTADAARRLGVKPRTVIDMVTKGRLHPRKYQRPGVAGGAVSLFDPEEIQTVIEQRAAAKTEIMPAGASSNAGAAPGAIATRADLTAALIGRFQQRDAISESREVVTLDEAAVISGYGRGILQSLIDAGKLTAKKAGRRGSVVILRADLARIWDLIE